ncbi:MAG: FAD-dependent oxidoreductase [Burkholderiales bacterium]|nr:FAD-dependent oxidoreductase [Burkholderiales bacterium]
MKRLLLIGGGIAHAELLAGLAAASTRNADVTLVHPRRLMILPSLAAELVAGQVSHAEACYDLGALAKRIRARFVEDAVVGLDAHARVATTESGQRLEFDVASIDAPTTTASPEVPGVRENALLARPTELFVEGFDRVVELVRDGLLRRIAFVGGGAWAAEMWLAAHRRLVREVPQATLAGCGFHLVTTGARLVEELPEAASEVFEAACMVRGISLLRGAAPIEVTRETLHLANGARLATDVTLWAQGNTPPRWLRAAGLALDAAGFLAVDAQLRSTSHAHVFAAGDSARVLGMPAAEDPVLRERQALLLTANVQAALAAQPLANWTEAPPAPRWFVVGEREAVMLRDGALVQSVRWWRWRRKMAAEAARRKRLQPA